MLWEGGKGFVLVTGYWIEPLVCMIWGMGDFGVKFSGWCACWDAGDEHCVEKLFVVYG